MKMNIDRLIEIVDGNLNDNLCCGCEKCGDIDISCYKCTSIAAEKIIDILKSFQSIIYCKDCKYWQDNNNGYPVVDCKWNKDETPDADDFCSFAEKMESDGE